MVAVVQLPPAMVGVHAQRGRGFTAAVALPAGALTPLALVVALVCSGAALPVRANPQGGVAIHGQATFDATQPNTRVNTQNGSAPDDSAAYVTERVVI